MPVSPRLTVPRLTSVPQAEVVQIDRTVVLPEALVSRAVTACVVEPFQPAMIDVDDMVVE